MAVFRIDKTRDYTVMANYHLRDISLSLKAKGLLSLMLSLPENWDYTTKGLARICKDGVDSICATVKELEKAGYVQRRRLRDDLGRLAEVSTISWAALSALAITITSPIWATAKSVTATPSRALSSPICGSRISSSSLSPKQMAVPTTMWKCCMAFIRPQAQTF